MTIDTSFSFLSLSILLLLPHALAVVVDPSCNPDGCTQALTNAINSCPASGPCLVQLVSGATYVLKGPDRQWRIYFANKRGLTLTATSTGNARIVIDGLGGGFHFESSTDVTFSRLTIDMARPPFTFGTCISNTASFSEFSVDPTYYSYPRTSQPWLYRVEAILEYDASANRPAVNAYDEYSLDSRASSCSWDAARRVIRVNGAHSVRVGRSYVLRHQVYVWQAIDFSRCTNTVLRDIQVYAAAGMGAVGVWSTGVTLQRFSVRKGPNRHMSTTSDGFHCTMCGGDISVSDSFFEGQGDDGINVPSMFDQILALYPPYRFKVAGSAASGPVQPINPHLRVGDDVVFRDRRTFQQYFRSRVTAIDSSTWMITVADQLPAQARVWDLTLDVTMSPRSVTIRNNVFLNNRARGVLAKASNLLLENNLFDHTTGAAVEAYPDGCYWFEADVSRNWAMINNNVSGCGYAAARMGADVFMAACRPDWNSDGTPKTSGQPVTSGQVFYNLTFANNRFWQDQGQSALALYGVNQLAIRGNRVSATTRPARNFLVSNSINSVVTGNVCDTNSAVYPCVVTGSARRSDVSFMDEEAMRPRWLPPDLELQRD